MWVADIYMTVNSAIQYLCFLQDVKQKKALNGGGKAGGKSPKDLMKAKIKAKKQMIKKSRKLAA